MSYPPSLHTHTHILTTVWQFLSFWTGKEKVGKRNVCVSGWRECVKRSGGGRKRGNSFSREGLRTAEKLRRRSGGWLGGGSGGAWVGWSHIGHVSVSVEMCFTLPLSSFSPRNSEEETPDLSKLTGQRKRGKQECSFKANQLIIVWEEAGHLQEGSSETHHCHRVKLIFFPFFPEK